jgi:hypothetical protein
VGRDASSLSDLAGSEGFPTLNVGVFLA